MIKNVFANSMLCLGICLFLSLACTRNDTLYNPSGQSSYKLAVYAADTTGISPNVSQDSIQSILKTQLSIDSSQAITLFGFITGDPSKVTPKWNFGDGKDTAGTIVVHTYDTTGQFHAVFSITDKAGFSIADTIVITVNSVPLSSRIAITTQPQSQVVATGQSVTFGAIASGNPTGYQWKKDGQNISGAVYASYTINAVQRSDSGGYTVVAIGNKTSVESDTAVLKVLYTPVITAQPITQTKSAGTSCTLSVAAAGYPLPTYQWNKNGVAIPGATQPTFSIASVQRSDSGGYTLVVSNSQGSDTSAVAALTINYAPIITTQPLSQTIAVNQSCTFSVVTAGYPLPTNQWNKNGVAISGATQPTYSIGSVQRTDSGSYTVVVSNSHGSITSAAAALMVGYVAITAQPQSQTKAAGQSCTLSVAAAGYPLPTYLWNKNGVAISGATQATYSIASVQRSDSGGYTVVVSNSQVNVTSAVAVLTVNYAPVIITQPQSQAVPAGESCTFSVVAAGYPMPTYQWYQNGAAISGATLASYSITNVQPANGGTYSVTVSNGTLPNATSIGAVLKVTSVAASIVMKNIPAVTFAMGSDSAVDLGASPPHLVTLSAFSMQETDVTQEQYLAVMGTNPAHFTGDLTRPVEMVSWFDAVRFCNASSKLSGLDTVYNTTTWTADLTKSGYRLPTEAQWEYACRAGSTTEYWWGPDTNGLGARTWWTYNSVDGTQPVATKLANAYGLYDMTGNVWQWCNDWYGAYTAGAATDPTGASTGTCRVLRGGSWDLDCGAVNGGCYEYVGNHFRSAFRTANYPLDGDEGIGFRVVLP